MIEFLLELLTQLAGETVIHGGGELVTHSLADSGRPRPRYPCWTCFGFLALGVWIGTISVLLYPQHVIPPAAQWLSLLLAPLVLGSVYAGFGSWFLGRICGQPGWSRVRFVCGFLLALGVGLVRLGFAG